MPEQGETSVFMFIHKNVIYNIQFKQHQSYRLLIIIFTEKIFALTLKDITQQIFALMKMSIV